MTKVQTIAKSLQAEGFSMQTMCEPEDGMDGEITINDLVYVQVGRGYVIVNKWVDGGQAIKHWPTRKSADQVIADVREAIAA